MTTQRRLGRGLEALLGNLHAPAALQPSTTTQASQSASPDPGVGLVSLSVYEVDSNPYQPRREFDEAEIESLAQSIRDHGLIQPIVVRQVAGRYQLIAGERRLRAATKAGWTRIPARVMQADDRQVAEVAIVENLQRKDLNALEKAASFQQYLATYGCTQEELAARLAIDRSTVANLIRLLDLPDAVQQALRAGSISAGHARALLSLGDKAAQIAFCERIRSEGLSVRAIEELVQETVRGDGQAELSVVDEEGQSRPAGKTRSKHLASLEQEFRTALGLKVQIQQTAKGRGKIVIHFSSHEEFDRLRGQLTHGSLPRSAAG